MNERLTGPDSRVPACLEATGRYGEALATALYQHAHTVSIVNPARIKYHAARKGLRHKSDRSDAYLIADYCHANTPAAWQPPTQAHQTLGAMVRQRDALERMHTQENNRLQTGLLPSAVREVVEQHLAFIRQQIATLDAQIQAHIDAHPVLQQQRELLITIHGIGALTAATLLGELPPIEQIASARSLAALAGLNPRREQSGTGRLYTRLSKAGRPAIRKALYFPALTAMRHNPLLKPFAERLAQRGLAPQQIVAAVMRKLLHYVYGVLKHQRPFDPTYLQP